MSRDNTPREPRICSITKAKSYEPICLYENVEGFQIFAFVEWKNDTTVRKIVFSQLAGSQQVGKVRFTRKKTLEIKLVKGAKSFKVFKLKKKLVKGEKYQVIIDFNEKQEVVEPYGNGSVIVREAP